MKRYLEFINESINKSSFGLYNMTNGDMHEFMSVLKELQNEKSDILDDKYFVYNYNSKENFLKIEVYDSRLADRLAEIINSYEIKGYKAELNDVKKINRIEIVPLKIEPKYNNI
jgi:hypothetical protein